MDTGSEDAAAPSISNTETNCLSAPQFSTVTLSFVVGSMTPLRETETV